MKKILFIAALFLTALVNAQTYFMPVPYTKLDQVWANRSVPTGQNLDSTWKSLVQYTINQIGSTGVINGTTGHFPKFTGAHTIGNSLLYQTGQGVYDSTNFIFPIGGYIGTKFSGIDSSYIQFNNNRFSYIQARSFLSTSGTSNFLMQGGITAWTMDGINSSNFTTITPDTTGVTITASSASGALTVPLGYSFKPASMTNGSASFLKFLSASTTDLGELQTSKGNQQATMQAVNSNGLFSNQSTVGNPGASHLTLQVQDSVHWQWSLNNSVKMWFNGNLGIGTNSPGQALVTVGNIQYSGGLMPSGATGTSGYVLTSQGGTNPDKWAAAATSGWGLTGNSGTTPGTNFVGTTDAIDFVIKTNNTEKVRVQSGGNVGIGTSAPSTLLQIKGTSPVIAITDGTQGTNRVLVSDSTGKGHWALPNYSGKTLFSDIYNRGSLGGNYTAHGTQTLSILNNEFRISGGTASGTFADYVEYTGYSTTLLNSWTQEMTFVDSSMSGTPDFIGIGLNSSSSTDTRTFYAGVYLTSGSVQAAIYTQSGSISLVATSSQVFTGAAVGDKIHMTLTYNNGAITFNAYDLSLNSGVNQLTCYYNYNLASLYPYGTPFSLPQGYFTILTYHGLQKVQDWVAYTNEIVNANVAYLGHSISTGFIVPNRETQSYRAIVSRYYGFNSAEIALGKTNNLTQDMINELPEVILMNPKNAVIMIGCNDVDQSVPSATIYANMDTINARLVRANISPIWLYAVPFNGIDVRGVNTHISANYAKYIDDYTPMVISTTTPNPIYYASDLVHPNNAGHLLIANLIIASNYLK